jgi:hypothetical protein
LTLIYNPFVLVKKKVLDFVVSSLGRKMESKADRERTYSREQQRLGEGLEAVATPVALVRSVTPKSVRSQRSLRSRRTCVCVCSGVGVGDC